MSEFFTVHGPPTNIVIPPPPLGALIGGPAAVTGHGSRRPDMYNGG